MQTDVLIKRQFVRIGNRHVHYRYAGHGPVLLLLHQSPQNSRMWLSMIERFASRYTVIAPDTPGFGYSDPLPDDAPGIEQFANATLEFADALGIDRFALFGMHTGGLIGMHLAWTAPQRLHCLIVDGYALFDDAERARYTDRYLPPFIPSWDGSHLRWLWSRMREQLYFFPWCDPSAECAIRLPPYSAQGTHDAAMDILDVGDNYRSGYGAAFRYTQRQRVGELRCPTWLVYRSDDVLLTHRQRLPTLPANVISVEDPDGVDGLHRRMDEILQETTSDAVHGATLEARDVSGWSRRMVATSVGEIAVWLKPGEGTLVLHLHAPGQQPTRPELQRDDECMHVAVELPGHGASSEITVAPSAAVMHGVLQAICTQFSSTLPVVVHAHEAACAYLPALARWLGVRLQQIVLHQPWLLQAAECATFLQQLPDPQVHAAGGHMAEAWQWERERHLLWPWLAPSAQARRLLAGPGTAQVHANVVELLRLGQRMRPLFVDAVVPHLAEQILALDVPVRLIASDEDDYEGRIALLRTQRLVTA
ncbi:alpha/beta hydrolase [Stenotrophomonas sp. Iso1]|uniref:alpha/beta fold hydrolase n=1 Tax=Stenotrophomonas sp. Iso1 TaxID=2977283 RepID=UPI0022B786CC|nr:alpha/beta hydrolase [Stenotrophomonas sp. Iso1]